LTTALTHNLIFFFIEAICLGSFLTEAVVRQYASVQLLHEAVETLCRVKKPHFFVLQRRTSAILHLLRRPAQLRANPAHLPPSRTPPTISHTSDMLGRHFVACTAPPLLRLHRRGGFWRHCGFFFFDQPSLLLHHRGAVHCHCRMT